MCHEFPGFWRSAKLLGAPLRAAGNSFLYFSPVLFLFSDLIDSHFLWVCFSFATISVEPGKIAPIKSHAHSPIFNQNNSWWLLFLTGADKIKITILNQCECYREFTAGQSSNL